MTTTASRTKRKYPSFSFSMHMKRPDGSIQPITVPTVTRPAKKAVTLTLTAEHVQKAIDLRGVGTTTECAMALCSFAHRDSFPHVVNGHIEWTLRRAYVVEKLKGGLPATSVAYDHHESIVLDGKRTSIARLNDSYGGQRRLLAWLKANGPLDVTLRPPPAHQPPRNRVHVKRTGPVKPRGPNGAHGRYARMNTGIAELAA